MRYHNMTRFLALLLVCMLTFQMAVPALAAEESAADQVGKIEIYSTWTEQVEWDALLHREDSGAYEILLKAEDIAALTGTTLSYRFDELVFARGTYEVRVDPVICSVLVYLNPPDGKERVLYGGEFLLPYCVVAEDVKNITETYLPLEKLFYLLNVTWFCYDSAVFISSPKETLWNIVGDYLLMAKATPKQAEVVSITVDGKVSDEIKYGLLAIADETDEMFDTAILAAFLQTSPFPWNEQMAMSAMMDYAMEPYESALAELSYPAAVRAVEVMGTEGDSVSGEIEDLFVLWSAIPETTNNLIDAFAQYGDLYEFIRKDEALFTQLLTISMKADGIPGVETVGFTVLDFLEYGMSMLEIIANADRSQYWTDGYVEQLDYMAGMELQFSTTGIRWAASSLREEYDEPGRQLLKEVTEQAIIETGSAIVEATPFGYALSVYEGILSGAKLVFPQLSDLMAVGSQHESACVQYDVSKVAVRDYTRTLETLLNDGLSQDMVDQVHLLGSLMTNASAHCYFNLYDIAKTLEDSGEEDARSSAAMLERFWENCELALRLEQAARYDPRLFIFKPYYNLYSEEAGAVRQQIPEDYVKIKPAVIVTVQLEREKTAHYQGSIVTPTVHIPGHSEVAERINAGVQNGLMDAIRKTVEMEKDLAADMQGADQKAFCSAWLYAAYTSGNALSLGMEQTEFYYTRPGHSRTFMVFDLRTGQQLQLTDLLDPDNPDGKQALQALLRNALKDVENNLPVRDNMRVDQTAADLMANKRSHIWYLGPEGLVVSYAFSGIWFQSNGYCNAVVEYEKLEGILDDAFLPEDRTGGGTCAVRDADGTEMSRIYGTQTGKALFAEGQNADVTVRSEEHEGILFYASLISNAMAWVPEAEQYTIHHR